jgi:signal transduction histidine kinase/putative methionine-R-sulfoxide reductase with GAF domain
MAQLILQSQESLEMLVMVSRLLSSKLDISELLTTIMRLASRVVGADRASLYLVDEKTQELYFDVALGLPDDVQKMRFKIGEGVAGTCAKEGRSTIINDVAADARHSKKADSKSGFVTKSLLTCPMIIKGKVIGVVQALNKLEGGFTETDKNNFEAFASQAAIAIENSRLFSSVKEEKRKMEIVFRRMKEAAVVTDNDGEILLINDSAKLFLEHDKYKFTSIKHAFPAFVMTPGMDAALACPEVTFGFELYREKPKRFYLNGTAIKLFSEDKDGNSRVDGRLWILSDVTAQRLETHMARNFLSLISHKFKTPLASINGYAQILNEEAAKGLPEIVRKSAGTISGQGQKLTGLVESLLDFVTVDSLEPASLDKIEFDASQFLEELAAAEKDRLEDAKVSIKVVVQGQVPVRADRKLLATAVRALVDNAVRFNPGPAKLVILTALTKDPNVFISVGDNGPGIPGEELDNIFQKFYQVEDSFTGQVQGWGLGLALVKKVAELHGGRALAKSQLQKGSAITLALPK